MTEYDHNGTPIVHGIDLDDETRCSHYHTPVDVVAMRFKCCDKYYACIHCHNECEDHEPIPWSKDEQDTLAVMCGVCKYEMTIHEYVHTDQCPNCSAAFNPRCEAHYHHYFTL
ncbi:hypothetical protein CD149_03815 [Staphylococcus condimenti]|uniref:CHY-type domain-containing protein n=1 Tax=Staphylococcus condimenti TaxID=70255 RepID=A0A143PAG6_9STAP|nr:MULTISPECIES: CHY zinc finger protein [Staphylococcus]AMY05467.1 hypothetical protein A4G25_05745 [Staphylococcus condimenti]APR61673.1 hypothetical protein BTZ13_10770 [Staphylococcus condimenti]MDK8644525.1 CHY zinc finger protein [Staphylococcus condimenti]OFP02606.1 hypothetical protein HMPREF3007_03090 [Staphylococcus sp. HMSC065E08]PNZ62045.1 hypothetical protein CD149_03815 [Staphylococcus condimenti]